MPWSVSRFSLFNQCIHFLGKKKRNVQFYIDKHTYHVFVNLKRNMFVSSFHWTLSLMQWCSNDCNASLNTHISTFITAYSSKIPTHIVHILLKMNSWWVMHTELKIKFTRKYKLLIRWTHPENEAFFMVIWLYPWHHPFVVRLNLKVLYFWKFTSYCSLKNPYGRAWGK